MAHYQEVDDTETSILRNEATGSYICLWSTGRSDVITQEMFSAFIQKTQIV